MASLTEAILHAMLDSILLIRFHFHSSILSETKSLLGKNFGGSPETSVIFSGNRKNLIFKNPDITLLLKDFESRGSIRKGDRDYIMTIRLRLQDEMR